MKMPLTLQTLALELDKLFPAFMLQAMWHHPRDSELEGIYAYSTRVERNGLFSLRTVNAGISLKEAVEEIERNYFIELSKDLERFNVLDSTQNYQNKYLGNRRFT